MRLVALYKCYMQLPNEVVFNQASVETKGSVSASQEFYRRPVKVKIIKAEIVEKHCASG